MIMDTTSHHHAIQPDRLSLRKEVLHRRDALEQGERERLSERILTRLRKRLELLGADYLHCYISFRSEVETRGFIEEVLERGLRVVVPVIEELDGVPFMVHTEIAHLRELKQGNFGLDEPIERAPASLEGLSAVIVPLSVFDRRGARLGYGKGFYDRFLAELPRHVERIGLAFSLQEVGQVPELPHDQRLDYVITEYETIHCTHSLNT
jgi:5-formyltetrahydrofolate cyclo-ligase